MLGKIKLIHVLPLNLSALALTEVEVGFWGFGDCFL